MLRINKLDESYVRDPRSYSASDGRLVPFGSALNGKVCLNDIKTGYYASYADIRAGQITYYKDNEVKRPFPSQLFRNLDDSIIHREEYVDPNGVHKTHHRITHNVDDKASCLSFIKDTESFRNDLLSSLMWRRHQEENENNEIL